MSDYDNIPDIQLKVANKVLAHAQAKEDSFSFDPWTIMVICNCIISICKLLYVCYSKESVASGIKTSSLLHRVLLKREVRKRFSDKSQRKAMFEAVLEAGASLSETELRELMESIEG